MEIQFCKIVDGEKDFVIIDHRDAALEDVISEEWTLDLCDRIQGIGATAVLFVENAVKFKGLSCRIVGAEISFEALHAFALFASAIGDEALSLSFSFESVWGDIEAVLSEDGLVCLSLAQELPGTPSCSIDEPEFIYSGVIDL